MNADFKELFKQTLSRRGWKFKNEEPDCGCTGYYALPPEMSTNPIRFRFYFEEVGVVCYATICSDVANDRLPQVAEFLLRINSALVRGSFELDYAQQSVVFKNFQDMSGFMAAKQDVQAEMADRFLRLPYLMIKDVWHQFKFVLNGQKDPCAAASEIISEHTA